jgi:hypothetical protein
MLFSGNPQTLQECRPSTQPCSLPYDVVVTAANTSVILGCTRSSDNTCPMGAVAYREYNSATPWSLQQCRVNGTCTTLVTAADRFAVQAMSASNTLMACLTLDPTPNSPTQQTCPAVPAVNFPIDVTLAPNGCGSVAVPCASAVTVMCLAPNATCPAQSYPFQLVRYNTADVPGTLAGCRTPRSFCDLTMPSMRPPPANGADPNAPDSGNYTIRLVSNGNLMGCLQGGASACPSTFAFPSRSSSGALQECNTNGTAIASCPLPSNAQFTVEAENQNGVVVECLSPFQPCPPSYPVAARVLAGSPPAVYIEKCVARSATAVCPTGFSFPFFAPLPDPSGANGALVTMLTNCWQPNVVTACNFQVC